MTLHESGVNYQNLVRDLAEMYPFEVAEVIVIELVANSLDAHATNISIDYDTQNGILAVTDDGEGMSISQFDDYHDFAAGLKTRGTGIGFAGVGAKISFNVADRVITETQSNSFSGGSNWYLKSKKRLVWEEIQPQHLQNRGTRVEVSFRSDSRPSNFTTEGLVQLLRRHYLPLFDQKFLDLYSRMEYYSSDLSFIINGQAIVPSNIIDDLALDKVEQVVPKKAGKRIGYGIFGLSASEYPLGICGVLLCAHGKVIKAELFGQFPGNLGSRLFGLVEVPHFIDFLTTAKTDFIHARGIKYKRFQDLYDPIKRDFKAWLEKLGIQTSEPVNTDEARKLENELKKLVEEIPELKEFFGFWSGEKVLRKNNGGDVEVRTDEGEVETTFPIGAGIGKGDTALLDMGDKPGSLPIKDQKDGKERADTISRTARRGPKISFQSAPDRLDLAWVDGNHVVINSGHPAYARVQSNATARRVHCFFALAAAVQRFIAAADNNEDLNFIDRLMAAWGRKWNQRN